MVATDNHFITDENTFVAFLGPGALIRDNNYERRTSSCKCENEPTIRN